MPVGPGSLPPDIQRVRDERPSTFEKKKWVWTFKKQENNFSKMFRGGRKEWLFRLSFPSETLQSCFPCFLVYSGVKGDRELFTRQIKGVLKNKDRIQKY